jgi:hypothetical protein
LTFNGLHGVISQKIGLFVVYVRYGLRIKETSGIKVASRACGQQGDIFQKIELTKCKFVRNIYPYQMSSNSMRKPGE